MQAVVRPLPGLVGGRSLAKLQKPAKNKIKKNREIDESCLCLQEPEMEVM